MNKLNLCLLLISCLFLCGVDSCVPVEDPDNDTTVTTTIVQDTSQYGKILYSIMENNYICYNYFWEEDNEIPKSVLDFFSANKDIESLENPDLIISVDKSICGETLESEFPNEKYDSCYYSEAFFICKSDIESVYDISLYDDEKKCGERSSAYAIGFTRIISRYYLNNDNASLYYGYDFEDHKRDCLAKGGVYEEYN